MKRRVVIAGGSGFIGRSLTASLTRRGWRVTILSRTSHVRVEGASTIFWDGRSVADWAGELEGAEAVINLAGRSVNCRYNAANRSEIYQSRLASTAAVGEAIGRCSTPPPVWINSSSATIYRHADDRPMDERTGELGEGFSVDVCRRWEQTLTEADTPQVRKIALRSALVLGRQPGGPLDVFVRLVRLGIGGRMASGNQMVSWVHAEDFVRAVLWIIDHPSLDGAINCAAPHAVTNRRFMSSLRTTLGRRFGLPAARWMLELGALLLRTETELALKSRWVAPGRLTQSGFRFRFPTVDSALRDLLTPELTTEDSHVDEPICLDA